MTTDTLSPAEELRARLGQGLTAWRDQTNALDAAFLAAAPATYATWQASMAIVLTGVRQRVVANGTYPDAIDGMRLLGTSLFNDTDNLQRQRRALLGL